MGSNESVGINEQANEQAMTHSRLGPTSSAGDPAQMLARQLATVVSAAAELLGVDCVGILLLDESDRVRTVAFTGPAAETLEMAQERLQLGPGIDVQSLRRVVAVPDLADNPSYRRLWQQVAEAGVRGVLSAPVWVGHQVVGNLNAITARAHEWSEAERRAGEAYASLVGQLLVSATRAARRADPP